MNRVAAPVLVALAVVALVALATHRPPPLVAPSWPASTEVGP